MLLKPMPRGGACWVQRQTGETSGKNGSHLDKTGLREDSLLRRSPLMFQQLNLSRSDSGIRGEIDSASAEISVHGGSGVRNPAEHSNSRRPRMRRIVVTFSAPRASQPDALGSSTIHHREYAQLVH